jgi:hypothetical protein
MMEYNLLKYWLLPLEDLQRGTRYHNSIPGDSPELMPLDETHRYHLKITKSSKLDTQRRDRPHATYVA